ncbi:MAG: glycosyltransferase family 2 protein [Acidobacteriota bacterium]|nr:glycosyltransferase family 2 protein [Acidobacteriota bacterium]
MQSLQNQSIRDFDVIVIDNSGRRLVAANGFTQIIFNAENLGFGGAVNQGIRASHAPFIATLNDDAVAHPGWLAALLEAAESRPDVGMCASQVVLAHDGRLDSAGMLLCPDGSSKQRGHGRPPSDYPRLEPVLLPSGSAALYRREMLDEIGLFDESFFLYCEDTDLGLRGRWAGWECLYVPGAVVEHRYSHSAGKASALKAYFVERNRLFLALKNLPVSVLLAMPFHSCSRYFWHLIFGLQGRGAASAFQQAGNSSYALPAIVLKAHRAFFQNARRLWQQRRCIKRRLTVRQFRRLLARFSITPRQVAAL